MFEKLCSQIDSSDFRGTALQNHEEHRHRILDVTERWAPSGKRLATTQMKSVPLLSRA